MSESTANSALDAGTRRYASPDMGRLVGLAGILMAVGAFAASAVARTWTVVPAPSPAAPLNSVLWAVSCPSNTSCFTVGNTTVGSSGTTHPLAERLSGGTWSLQTPPAPAGATGSQLVSVSCSSPSSCIAVGDFNPPGDRTASLAERWNGTRWTITHVPSPSPSAPIHTLTGVSCTSASSCIAVGSFGHDEEFPPASFPALIVRWNGHGWSQLNALSNPPGTVDQLAAIDCFSASACMAIGQFSSTTVGGTALAWWWNGQRWRNTSPRNHGESVQLEGVACPTRRACVTVGAFLVSRGQEAFSETWNGTRWRHQTSPRPSDSGAADLRGVWCSSGASCVSVGGSGPVDPNGSLAENWNGMHWTIQPMPMPDSDSPDGVDCRPSFCIAVGAVIGGPRDTTLIERYA